MEESKNQKKKRTGGKSKSSKSVLNSFYIVSVLQKHTSREEPMTAKEIAKHVNIDFGEDFISESTVKRIMTQMRKNVFKAQASYDPDEIGGEQEIQEIREERGCYIHTVQKVGKTRTGKAIYKELFYDDEEDNEGDREQNKINQNDTEEEKSKKRKENAKKPTKYYYYESDLKPGEFQALKIAIETCSYFTTEDVQNIIRKLIGVNQKAFWSKAENYKDISKSERVEHSSLLENLTKLDSIIQHKNKAEIEYCYMGKCGNKVDLITRNNYPKKVTPVQLMMANGYYYVIILNENEKYKDQNKTINLRVDRIRNIKEVEEDAEYTKLEDPVQYKQQHPVMYAGKVDRVTILCRDTGYHSILNSLVDTVGKGVRIIELKPKSERDRQMIRKLDPDIDTQNENKKNYSWYWIGANAAHAGIELWATQYCRDCVVIEPQELAKKIKKNLSEGLQHYDDISLNDND